MLLLTEDRLLPLLLRLTDDLLEDEEDRLILLTLPVLFLKNPLMRCKKVSLSCLVLVEFKFTFLALSSVSRSLEELLKEFWLATERGRTTL